MQEASDTAGGYHMTGNPFDEEKLMTQSLQSMDFDGDPANGGGAGYGMQEYAEDPAYDRVPIDTDRLRKIIYFVEGATENSIAWFVLAGLVMALAIIFGVITGTPGIWIILAMGALLSTGLCIKGIGLRKDKTTRLYRSVHDRLMNEGVMCIGYIASMNLVKKESHPVAEAFLIVADQRYVNQDKNYYNYTVVYMDPDHNEKTTETYIVANPKESYVGKRCTVYVSEGKAIVDAIER